jgi:integrase
MGKGVNRLTDKEVRSARKSGTYLADGGGLYLQVTAFGTKNWVFRFTSPATGKRREMGLGPLITISLAEARGRALSCRKLLLDGIDPINHRDMQREQAVPVVVKLPVFDECASKYIAMKRPEWSNPKHAAQWASTLATYASPVIGKLAVDQIETRHVMEILEPIWVTKTESAKRLRGRIESILDWAKVAGYRQGENPARWKGHLDHLLAKPGKVQKVEHHAALPYKQLPAFMRTLGEQDSISARALAFCILTATRTSETLGARWDEIDLVERMWTLPAGRMKANREHRVPLSTTAVALLEEMKRIVGSDYVFPGQRNGKPLSNMALLMTLRRMGRGDLTAHGFRSTFRDWAAEQTTYPSEVAEMALAHAVGNKVEAAYRRGDLLEKRRRLMDEWDTYCQLESSTEAGTSSVTPTRKVN